MAFIALGAAGLAACGGDGGGDQNILIATNVPADAEIETLPPDDSSGIAAEDLDNGAADTNRP